MGFSKVAHSEIFSRVVGGGERMNGRRCNESVLRMRLHVCVAENQDGEYQE